ncbi:MAG: flagellar motor protein MotA [Magnetospirillum sp. WYHS-4]
MAKPRRYLVRMIMFVLAVGILIGLLHQPLLAAFMNNVPLNGLILGVFIIGIAFNFRQVALLYPEAVWLEGFMRDRPAMSGAKPPRLLAPMATMLGEKREKFTLSALSTRSLLDGIASRLDESRDMSRYTIGLLIFLGLLGTFWGLMETVGSIHRVIAGMTVSGNDIASTFAELKKSLETPLAGMGTAFSTSLFGLAGSLVLGFLDLQAGQAQNRFYNDLEEWLSSLTRLSSGALSSEGDTGGVPAYVQALLEQTAESLENLQRTLARGEEGRIAANNNLMALGDRIGTLTDHMRTEQSLMLKLAEGQAELRPVLMRLAEAYSSQARPAAAVAAPSGAMDETTRTHIRNIDLYMARLVEDLHAGRDQLVQQIRSEIKLLARTIAAADRPSSGPGPGR